MILFVINNDKYVIWQWEIPFLDDCSWLYSEPAPLVSSWQWGKSTIVILDDFPIYKHPFTGDFPKLSTPFTDDFPANDRERLDSWRVDVEPQRRCWLDVTLQQAWAIIRNSCIRCIRYVMSVCLNTYGSSYIYMYMYIYVCMYTYDVSTDHGAMSEMCHRGCRCHRRAALHWGGGRPILQNRRSLGCIKVLWYLGYFQWNSIIQDIKMIPNSNSLWSYNFNHSTLLSFSSWSNPPWKRVNFSFSQSNVM